MHTTFFILSLVFLKLLIEMLHYFWATLYILFNHQNVNQVIKADYFNTFQKCKEVKNLYFSAFITIV